MIQQQLEEQGIFIRPFVHRNGSPYGQYWGYIVVHENGHDLPTLYGRKSSGPNLPHDPFVSRREALILALKIAHSTMEPDLGYDVLEDPWIELGGEG